MSGTSDKTRLDWENTLIVIDSEEDREAYLKLVLSRAEDRLNNALATYEEPRNNVAQEIRDLNLQAAIFNYDISYDMCNLLRTRPQGFAQQVALKSLILRLYEYDLLYNQSIIPRFRTLMAKRGIPYPDKKITELVKEKWKSEFSEIRNTFGEIRNKAAGHYGRDLPLQVSVLKKLDQARVIKIVKAVIEYNQEWLILLRDSGQHLNKMHGRLPL